MRKIQSMRKETGLVKSDKITAYVRTTDDMAARLKTWKEAIAEKVGATQLIISKNEPGRMHEHRSVAKVKGEKFVVDFDKV